MTMPAMAPEERLLFRSDCGERRVREWERGREGMMGLGFGFEAVVLFGLVVSRGLMVVLGLVDEAWAGGCLMSFSWPKSALLG